MKVVYKDAVIIRGLWIKLRKLKEKCYLQELSRVVSLKIIPSDEQDDEILRLRVQSRYNVKENIHIRRKVYGIGEYSTNRTGMSDKGESKWREIIHMMQGVSLY